LIKKARDGRRLKLNVSDGTPILMDPSRKESRKVLALNQEANPPPWMILCRIKVTMLVPNKILEEQESSTRKLRSDTVNIELSILTWVRAIFKYNFSNKCTVRGVSPHPE
jgi:hypothetical protein